MRLALIALLACDHAAAPPPPRQPVLAVTRDPGIDNIDSYGWTALHHAAEDGKLAEIERLVAHGANLEARTSQNETPLLVALDYDQHDAAVWLLAHGASVAGDVGRTALVIAARDGQDDVVDRLLGAGVPLAGSIALELAAKYDHVSTIELLVRRGADANFGDPDDHGFTPLIVAAQENHVKAVQALLDAGAPAEQRDADGTTALHWAVYGARPNEIHIYESLDKPHDTVFEPQASAPVVKLLLARGAKVDSADPQGNTALIEAVFMDSEVAVKELLAAGADRRHKNREGKTAYDIAHARKSSFEALLHP